MLKKYSLLVTVFITFSGLCMAESSETLLYKANIVRESGMTLEALNLYNQALVSYQKERDYQGILRVLTGRLISWQHLFNQEENKVYAILAKKEVEAMLAISQEYGIHDQDSLIHFLLGKTCILLKDFVCAETEFKKAIDLFPQDNAEKGDWLAHLGEAVYKNGRKEEGERLILEGIQLIEKNRPADSFQFNVWVSGAYLRLAKILINDQKKEQGSKYLQKAEEIISKDPRLVIRNQQLMLLKEKMD